jgi:hypothetical protein
MAFKTSSGISGLSAIVVRASPGANCIIKKLKDEIPINIGMM